MGASWNYFKHYEIKDEEIYYSDGDTLDITYGTSALLASVVEHFGVLLPVYDSYNPPFNKVLDDLIEPRVVEVAATKGVELLSSEYNPFVKQFYSSDEIEPLFDEKDLEALKIENGSLRYQLICQLTKIKNLSKDGYYFVRENG